MSFSVRGLPGVRASTCLARAAGRRTFRSWPLERGTLAGMLAGLLLVSAACSSPGAGTTEVAGAGGPPRAGRPLVIGHAGMGFLTPFGPFNALPPSSAASIRRALALGVDGVEVDVRLSQDSVAVLYHDAELESMTTGKGCVSQTPARELAGLRYQVRWPFRWFGPTQGLSRLDSLLAEFAGRPVFPHLHLDLHEDDPCASNDAAREAALARQLGVLLARYPAPAGRVTIVSRRAAMLVRAGRLVPAGTVLALEVADAEYEAAVATLAELPGVGAVVLHKDAITPARVAQLHGLGRQVIAFGGRSAQAVRRVVAAGPDAYEVDHIKELLQQLQPRPAGSN